MEFRRRIVLEDTGERRFPQDHEHYLCLTDDTHRVYNAEEYDGEYNGKPGDFAILRVVENEWTWPGVADLKTAIVTETGLQCPHCGGSEVRIIEEGYDRYNGIVTRDKHGTFQCSASGSSGFSEEGNGRMYLECPGYRCGKTLQAPAGFEFEWA